MTDVGKAVKGDLARKASLCAKPSLVSFKALVQLRRVCLVWAFFSRTARLFGVRGLLGFPLKPTKAGGGFPPGCGKSARGLVVMSPELEEVADGILTDRTPSVA